MEASLQPCANSPGDILVLVILSLLCVATLSPWHTVPEACGQPWWPKSLDMTRRWPWEVSLRVENEHVCGGALIDLDWVVTAAHCIQGTKEYSVILGTSKLMPPNSTRTLWVPVRDIIMHPKYWGRTFIMGDVALLRLHSPVIISKYVQPICLPEPNYNLKVGTQCWVTGWGQVKQRFSANSTLAPELQEAEVFIMDNKKCDQMYRKMSRIPRVVPLVLGDMICATNYREDLCSGDSGGPLACEVEGRWILAGVLSWEKACAKGNSGNSLVCQMNNTWIQMGVVSWSFSCNQRHFPGVYTSTSYFTDWMRQQIGDVSTRGQGPTVVTRLEGRWDHLEIPDANPRGWAFISPGRDGSGLPEKEVQKPAEMELWCGPPAGRRGPPRPGTSTLALALAFAGLLLLLLRPLGCLGAGDALGALSTDVPADLDSLCAPSATCPSGRRRSPRQVTGGSQPPSILQDSASKASDSEFLPPCGFSYERDPTLRDPESMARRWPWMVSVRANGTHICAGTLIASEWVLTAAHCTTQSDVTYSVRVGSPWIDQITKTTIDVPAEDVIMHSRYRANRYWSWVGRANDIALLHLERPLQYSKYVWPICLPGLDYSVKDYSLCTVTGWGLPRADGVWPQFRTIQEKEVIILNSTVCDSLYRRLSKITSLIQIINSQMICAKDVDREKFCYEISGEPLACPVQNIWHLVGVVSWGLGCKKSEAPPIYVHVSSYQQWIGERISGQTLPAPSQALLLALLMLLSFLAAL